MGLKEQGADTNKFSNPDQEKLHMDKYLVDKDGYPYVPIEHLPQNSIGTFSPIDIVRGRIVVRHA